MPPSDFLQSVQAQSRTPALRSCVRFFRERTWIWFRMPRADSTRLPAGRSFAVPGAYLYNPGNTATRMVALDGYGTKDYQLLRTVANSPATECLRHYLGDDVLCSLTHSRLRKNYPQRDLNRPRPSTVRGTPTAAELNYYSAYILWVPFTPCNDDHTGLELQRSTAQPPALTSALATPCCSATNCCIGPRIVPPRRNPASAVTCAFSERLIFRPAFIRKLRRSRC